MGRTFTRKTPRVSDTAVAEAIEAMKGGMKLNTAAKTFNVPRTTLRRRWQKPKVPQHHTQPE